MNIPKDERKIEIQKIINDDNLGVDKKAYFLTVYFLKIDNINKPLDLETLKEMLNSPTLKDKKFDDTKVDFIEHIYGVPNTSLGNHNFENIRQARIQNVIESEHNDTVKLLFLETYCYKGKSLNKESKEKIKDTLGKKLSFNDTFEVLEKEFKPNKKTFQNFKTMMSYFPQKLTQTINNTIQELRQRAFPTKKLKEENKI